MSAPPPPAARLAAAAVAAAVLAGPAPAGDKLQYNKDVRPILAENCFACHGPDSAARKADLRLDGREAALAGGAIVPGKSDESTAIQRILTDDEAEVMPPPKSHKKLTPAQKDVLKRWVAEGAEYQPHWSFIPPTRPAVPTGVGPVRNPIDAFVAAELAKRGLSMAPEADRRTLARRLSLDLVGLPPKPEDVEAFVADKSADSYERYVDKLLASPHWGEHRGRYWLDAARYADTHGIHFDNYRENWAYRDWVFDAFNANMPFDRFTVEQLAGDLLPDPSLDQLVATGFNRCNITTNEGGAINEEYLVLYTRDRTETVAQTWLGLTAGCAVCHDHKFDPLSAREFYSLAAFFNNTTQAAMDGNVADTPPVIPVPRAEDRARWAALTGELKAARAKLAGRKAAAKPDFEKWVAGVKDPRAAVKTPTAGLRLHAPLAEGGGKAVALAVDGEVRTVTADGVEWAAGKDGRKAFTVRPSGPAVEVPDAGDFDRGQPFTVSAWVTVGKRNTTGAVAARMDEAAGYRGWDLWLEADRAAVHLVHKFPEDALKVVAKAPLPAGKPVHVTAAYDGSGKAAGVTILYDGEPQPVAVEVDALKGTTRTAVPLKVGQRHAGQRAAGVAVADLRVYDRAITGADAVQLAGARRAADVLTKPADKRAPAELDDLLGWWVAARDPAYQALAADRRRLQDEEAAIRSRGTVAHVAAEKPAPPEAFVLHRGEYDQRRDKVGPGTPKVLPAFDADLPRNRLGFARWLLRPDHPLTARVTVNRFWQEVFGTGLVRSAGDFGTTGELPSHPELLDWLAVEFREGGWDVKGFFKLLVTSAAYRQSAAVTPDKLEKDRDNRLLSRGPRFRLDAEAVRDYALAASGLLVRTVGGPSARPYQPDGVWEAVAMPESNTRRYRRDSGENLYRRSVYTFWKRAAPPASMEVFNAPNRETCAVRRDRTNTPLQALVTLNDVQFVEAARVLAEAALKAAAGDEARVDVAARRLLARPFRADELEVALGSLAALRAEYKAKPEEARKLIGFGESKADPAIDPGELAAWTMLVNELLNLDEVLNK